MAPSWNLAVSETVCTFLLSKEKNVNKKSLSHFREVGQKSIQIIFE